jgi:DNA-binding Lrp family transcriptional regulator
MPRWRIGTRVAAIASGAGMRESFFADFREGTTMVRAFIMVKAEAGRAEALLERIRELEHVADAHVIAGDFDVIVEAEAGDVSDVISGVATRIRGFEDVEDTKTYICLE